LQVVVLATSVKGELTVAPLPGALTVMAETVTVDVKRPRIAIR
jgi:hypothetical protein